MPILNYQQKFAPLVESGKKRQTIRAMRKRPFQEGERLYHYTGLRTKKCRKLLENNCKLAHLIEITTDKIQVFRYSIIFGKIEILFKDNFAQLDGFEDWPEMKAWFIKHHKIHIKPFHGQLIKW